MIHKFLLDELNIHKLLQEFCLWKWVGKGAIINSTANKKTQKGHFSKKPENFTQDK
jgi:hypothetical protein